MEILSKVVALTQHTFSSLPQPAVPGSTLWVAYSGGVDSTVLLHAAVAVLRPFGFQIQAIHIHHGLYVAADQWMRHCQTVAAQWQVPLTVKQLTTQPQAGESIEAWARAERRLAFAQVMLAGDILLTAHHADDQAETLLLQLMRGAGVAGLAAMPAWDEFAEGYCWRPFLSLSKSDLQRYAEELSLSWINDHSNADLRFDRNFLRHQIMPLLHQRWPGMVNAVGRAASNCADAAQIINAAVAAVLPTVLITPQQVSITALAGLELPLRKAVLRQWIYEVSAVHPTQLQLEEVLERVIAAESDAMPQMTFGAFQLKRYQTSLYLLAASRVPTAYYIAWDGEQPLSVPGWSVPLTKACLKEQGLEVDQYDWSQVTVRSRQGGERYHIPGRAHTHALKKWLQEQHVPVWRRDQLPLIFCGDQLIFVVQNLPK